MSKGKTTVSLREEVESSYLAYSMAVILGRAIPDVYDGLKPVQRRILTAMKGLGLKSEGPHKKSSRVSGETMGKYHPHGDSYGSMVTLAAPYSNNHPLIDGQGNWGSPTDPAASSRYTECRLSAYSEEVLLGDFKLCETRDNYDGSLKEPITLESKVPNVLVLGSEGIGVGYATNIPQHNLRGVCQATVSLIGGKRSLKNLVPDFPSGCDIVQDDGLEKYLETGRGSIRMRAKHTVEDYPREGRKANWWKLTFTNLPYQSNTEQIGEEIHSALEKGLLTSVTDVRDESDRTGDRLVVFCKDSPEETVKQLYQHTKLDRKFGANNTVIHEMVPKTISSSEIISLWLEWRDGRLILKFSEELESKKGRIHVLEGLLLALMSIDEVISLIRGSKKREEAKEKLQETFKLSESQSDAILELKLHQLTGLDILLLQEEIDELRVDLERLKGLLEDKDKRKTYLKEEILYISKRHGFKRVCDIVPLKEGPEEGKKAGSVTVAAKSLYLKVNLKKGVVEELKSPRGANLVLTTNDKLIVLSKDGVVKRLGCRHKGSCFDTPTPLVLSQKQSVVESREYLALWMYEGNVYSNKLVGDDLRKTTSKGKRWFPEGAELIFFGEGSYKIRWKSSRKKARTLNLKNTKRRPVGSKGNKVCSREDLMI